MTGLRVSLGHAGRVKNNALRVEITMDDAGILLGVLELVKDRIELPPDALGVVERRIEVLQAAMQEAGGDAPA